MIPPKPTDIFSYISHFIFAIIIAFSYSTAIEIFFNPENQFNFNYETIIPCLQLLLAYAFIISGWVGYSRAMFKWTHTDTKLGVVRFVIDLAILFCYFGLLEFTNPEYNFQEHHMGWIITTFILFFVWDICKIKEYKTKKRDSKKNLRLLKSIAITLLFLIIFMLMLWVLNMYIANNDLFYMIFLVVLIFIVILYRYLKWSIKSQNKSTIRSKTL